MRRHDAPPLGSVEHPRCRQRGATLVEFAIPASFSIGLLFLIIEFGIAMFNQGVLMHASRVGAREASLYWESGTPPVQKLPDTRIRNATDAWANMTVKLTAVNHTTSICWYSKDSTMPTFAELAGNTLCQVDKLPGGATVKPDDMVMVRTRLAYSGPISLALNGFGLNLNLGSLAVMRVE